MAAQLLVVLALLKLNTSCLGPLNCSTTWGGDLFGGRPSPDRPRTTSPSTKQITGSSTVHWHRLLNVQLVPTAATLLLAAEFTIAYMFAPAS